MDALPPSIAGLLQDLERRIGILERANKLLISTIVGGALVVKDDDEVEIARVGRLVSGFDGLRVQTETGGALLEADQERGVVSPWLATPWVDNTLTKVVTSGTYATIWETQTELLFSYSILFRVRVATPAGTTGEIRLVHAQSSTQLGGVSVVGDGTDAYHEFRYVHGLSMNSGPHTFRLQAKRTGGAGNVELYEPYPFSYGANMSTDPDGWV